MVAMIGVVVCNPQEDVSGTVVAKWEEPESWKTIQRWCGKVPCPYTEYDDPDFGIIVWDKDSTHEAHKVYVDKAAWNKIKIGDHFESP